eukprot:12772663-Ditylum_brightwellii.AAC.2
MLIHRTAFLHVAMVKFCKSDITMEVNHTAIITQPLILAKQWASTKFLSVFPTTPKTQKNPQEAHHSKPQYPHAMFTEPSQSTPPAVSEETYGMSTTELANTLKMSGIKSGDHELLPEWFKVVAAKGQNDNTCNQAI